MSTIRTSAVLAVAVVGLTAGSARAQETVVVHVPFSFIVRGEELPAGKYDLTSENGILTIQGTDNASRALALTQPADGRDPVGQPAVVFVRYENQNLLSQVWASETEGIALPANTQRMGGEVMRQSSIVITPVSESAAK